MKFSKLNHLSILTLFAIGFIVVYLYYTISDVKKIHNEVKRMSQDIDKLNQGISNITTSIIPMLSLSCPTETPQASHKQVVSSSINNNISSTSPIEVVDDEASVGSQELTKIMETIDDEDMELDITQKYDIDGIDEKEQEPVVLTEDTIPNINIPSLVVQPSTTVDIASLTAEELKKVPYNDIKKHCKKHNIDDKGSKEILIYRIKNATRS